MGVRIFVNDTEPIYFLIWKGAARDHEIGMRPSYWAMYPARINTPYHQIPGISLAAQYNRERLV